MIFLENEEEQVTTRIAQAIAPHLKASDLVVLSGGLGAGKTYFTRALLYALGLSEEERVPSPTFTLVHEYQLDILVLHADLYRLAHPDEAFELGLLEQRQRGALLVVEWGRPYVHELGDDALYFDLQTDPRRFIVSGTCPRAVEVMQALQVELLPLMVASSKEEHE